MVLASKQAGWPRPQLLSFVIGLSTCWMTLFGPIVESFTYILVGPTIAWLLLDAWLGWRPVWYRCLSISSWVLFASAAVAPWFLCSSAYHRFGPHPIAGLLLLTALLADAGTRVRTGT